MAESVYRSSDVPDFDAYPMTPLSGSEVGEIGQVPERDHSSLEKHAAALGAAAGNLVRILRRKSDEIGSLPQPDIAGFVGEIADYARGQMERVRVRTVARAHEVEEFAKEKAAVVVRETRDGMVRARIRAQQVTNDYPVQVAIGAGVVGLLIGIGLRIRRANRA